MLLLLVLGHILSRKSQDGPRKFIGFLIHSFIHQTLKTGVVRVEGEQSPRATESGLYLEGIGEPHGVSSRGVRGSDLHLDASRA